MSEEQTNLVEEAASAESTTQEQETVETAATESTESTEEAKFDPLAFASDQMMEQFQGKYNEEAAEKVENAQSEETEESTDGFSWDSIETEQKEQPQQVQEDEDWDVDPQPEAAKEAKSVQETGELDWSKFAKELGIQGASKEDIIKALNSPFVDQPNNEAIGRMNQYLNMNDRELIGAEMKTDGMEDFEIEEAIDKMEDSGVMKREAYRIRRQLKQAIEQEKTKFYKQKQEEEMSAKEKVARNKKELQGHLKSLDTFMGGRVTKGQAQEAYKYITSGKMAEDIWNSHDNASEVAMFMLFKDKFAKILRNQGLEDGKASILNDITSPSLSSKSRPKTSVKKSGFDPAAFMRE